MNNLKLFIFSYIYKYIFIYLKKLSEITNAIKDLMEYCVDKYAILSDFHKLFLNCLILLILFAYFFFFENFSWKNIFIYSIKILVSVDDDNLIKKLIDNNIIEAVISVFDEKEDKNTNVYFNFFFFASFF